MEENRKIVNKQKNMILEISSDNNFAWLTILGSSNMIDENELIEFLNMSGVRFGFENATKQNKEDSVIKQKEIPFLIAKGSVFPPKPRFELYFDPSEKKQISSNTVLAKLFQSDEESVIGKDIFGHEVTSDNYLFDAEKFCGKNCTVDDNMQIIAVKAGIPLIDENKIISIQTETILDNIIDKELTFQDDVIVNGEINSSKLMINGNLVVFGDIVDCEKGIYVNGDVKFLNAKRSNIYCSGKITFENSCDFCKILAESEIIGGENSSIVGGNTQSGKEISISTAGNSYEEPTSLEISIAPYLKEQIKLLDREIAFYSAEQEVGKDNLIKQKEELENKFIQEITDSLESKFGYKIEVRNTIYKSSFLRVHNKNIIIDKDGEGYILHL